MPLKVMRTIRLITYEWLCYRVDHGGGNCWEKNENDSNDGVDLLVPDAGEGKTKKAKKNKRKQKEILLFTWKKRANPHEREECSLKTEVIIEEMQEHCTPFDMFRKVTNLDELINLIVVQSNS